LSIFTPGNLNPRCSTLLAGFALQQIPSNHIENPPNAAAKTIEIGTESQYGTAFVKNGVNMPRTTLADARLLQKLVIHLMRSL
jgi:hypothetical protein